MVRSIWVSERRMRVASTGTELLPITFATLSLYLARMMISPAMFQMYNGNTNCSHVLEYASMSPHPSPDSAML